MRRAFARRAFACGSALARASVRDVFSAPSGHACVGRAGASRGGWKRARAGASFGMRNADSFERFLPRRLTVC